MRCFHTLFTGFDINHRGNFYPHHIQSYPIPLHGKIVYMKKWQLWVGVLISAVFLYVSLRGLKLGEFWKAIQTANYWWIVPGVAVYFVAVLARAWRWHYLLRPIKKIPTRRMFPVTCIGYMGNNIYPARAGEVLRGSYFETQGRRTDLRLPGNHHCGTDIRWGGGTSIRLCQPAPTSETGEFQFRIDWRYSNLIPSGSGNIRGSSYYFSFSSHVPEIHRKNRTMVYRANPPKTLPGKNIGNHAQIPGRSGIPEIPIQCIDGLPDVGSNLAARNGQVLACYARICLHGKFLCLDADERHCQPGDDHSLRTWIHRNFRRAGNCSIERIWGRTITGDRIYSGTSRGTLAANHSAGSIFHGAGRNQVERLTEDRNKRTRSAD